MLNGDVSSTYAQEGLVLCAAPLDAGDLCLDMLNTPAAQPRHQA
jgi:hypothetical protein